MKKRYTVFANKRRRAIRASKDYATLRGMDFKKAKDILTKDGFYEHEYGDKDNNNGYAVYRKGNKEVELQYRWVAGKRKGDAHAGKVTNIYVDEDINSATRVRSRKSIKAGYSPKEILWVLDDDNTWKCWGSVGPRMKSMSDAELLDSLNSPGNNYIDVLITKNGENPDEYGRTESVKDPFIRESTRIGSRRAIKASVDDAEVDLTFIGEPSAIMDLKNAALSAGDTITRFNANTLIIHTWDYMIDDYKEYADDLGLSVDDVNYVKSAKKITCSYDADDIVMYFNGKKVFTGKWYDIVDTIEDLCKDPDVNSAFQDWCMQYNLGNGNYDVVFDGTPRDTAAVFWSLIDNVYEESDYSDFYVDGDGILDFEIFYADQEVGIPD